MITGQVQCMGESIPQAAFHHKQCKVCALAVTGKDRNPALPDVPTMIEAGVKGFKVVDFYDFLAPVGLPKNITAKLSDSLIQVMTNPDVRVRVVTCSTDMAFWDAMRLRSFLANEKSRWTQAV